MEFSDELSTTERALLELIRIKIKPLLDGRSRWQVTLHGGPKDVQVEVKTFDRLYMDAAEQGSQR